MGRTSSGDILISSCSYGFEAYPAKKEVQFSGLPERTSSGRVSRPSQKPCMNGNHKILLNSKY